MRSSNTMGRRATTGWRATIVAAAVAALVLVAPATQAGAAAPAWRVQAGVSAPGQQDVGLSGIACRSRSNCVSVGSAGSTGFAERWDGRAWGRAVTIRVPGATSVALYGVACPAVNDCFAVGITSTKGGNAALIEHWNGTRWAVSSAFPVDSQGLQLTGVACASPSSCFAVGSFTTARGDERALIERWNGRTWSSSPPPPLTSSNVFLLAVSCPALSSCTAVGVKGFGTDSLPLVEHWNGTSWRAQRAPAANTVAHTNSLNGVSCTSPTACTAVGEWSPSSAATGTHPLVERYNGRIWRVEKVPVPAAAAETAGFNAVTCTAARSCTAVGSFGPNGAYETLAAQWNGSAWAVQTTGNVGDASTLLSVSCVAGTCRAVGSSLVGPALGNERSRPLVEVR